MTMRRLQRGVTLGELLFARRTLLRSGTKRFGLPTSEIRDEIEQCQDLSRFERMLEQIDSAHDWSAVIAIE